jgi:hypothetical protein
MDPPLIDAKQIISKLERRLNILRNAGAVADYRIVQSSDRLSVQVLPGDSLLMGEDLRQFVGSMMGADLATEHVTVVTTFDKVDGSG